MPSPLNETGNSNLLLSISVSAFRVRSSPRRQLKKLFIQLLRVRWRAIYDFPTLEYRPPMTFVVVRGRREQSQQGQGLETKHFEFSVFVWSRQVQERCKFIFQQSGKLMTFIGQLPLARWSPTRNRTWWSQDFRFLSEAKAKCQVMSAITKTWASTRFGHPHSPNPNDMGIPCNPNPNSNSKGRGRLYH